MTTTFAHIPENLHDKESFFDDFKDAQWHWLTEEQSTKLVWILNKDTVLAENVPENVSPDEANDPNNVIIHGEIADVLDQLKPDQLHDIEAWISYLVRQQKSWDLLVAQRSQQKWSWWWESTIWPVWFIEDYNIISKKNEKELPQWSTHYKLLLRVKPHYGNENTAKNIDISAELVEIPSHSAPRVSMTMPGMIFKKNLNPKEFLDYINNQPKDVLVGQAA